MIDLERFREVWPDAADADLLRIRDGLYSVAGDWIKAHGADSLAVAKAFPWAEALEDFRRRGIIDADGNLIPLRDEEDDA
jgi:hypothetical protein